MYQQQPAPRAAVGDGAPPMAPGPGSPVAWRPPASVPAATPAATRPGPMIWAPPAHAAVWSSAGTPLPVQEAPAAVPSRRRIPASSIALLASLLVATAGVSFAIGRLTAEDGTPSRVGSAALASVGAAGAAAPQASDDPGTTTDEADDVSGDVPGVSNADTDPAQAELQGLASDAGSAADGPGSGERMPGLGGPMGFGGLQGSVTAIGDGLLTIETSDGQSLSVTIDDSTSFVRQTAIVASDVVVGDEVSVRTAGGMGGGRPAAGGAGTAPGGGVATTGDEIVAGQVTLLESAAD